jgi:hypothetical protein
MTFFKFNNFIKDLRGVSLRADEQAELRSDFLNKIGATHSPAPLYTYFISMRFVRVVAFSFALFIIVMSPIAFAAQNAEPGDALYTFKEAVNKPIQKTAYKIIGKPLPKTETNPKDESESKNTEGKDSFNVKNVEKKIEHNKPIPPGQLKKISLPSSITSTSTFDLNKKIKDKVEDIEDIIDDTVTSHDTDKEDASITDEDSDEDEKDIKEEVKDAVDDIHEAIPKVDLSL